MCVCVCVCVCDRVRACVCVCTSPTPSERMHPRHCHVLHTCMSPPPPPRPPLALQRPVFWSDAASSATYHCIPPTAYRPVGHSLPVPSLCRDPTAAPSEPRHRLFWGYGTCGTHLRPIRPHRRALRPPGHGPPLLFARLLPHITPAPGPPRCPLLTRPLGAVVALKQPPPPPLPLPLSGCNPVALGGGGGANQRTSTEGPTYASA